MDATSRRNRQLEAVLGAFPDISFVIDRRGRYLEVIGGVDERLYEDGRGLTGHTLHEVLPAETADHFLDVVHRALGSGELQRVEYTLSARQVRSLDNERRRSPRAGTPQWFDGRVLPLPGYEADEPVVLWVAFNVTERKALEEELRRLATTDDLTGLCNRRTALQQLGRIHQRARQGHAQLSLLLLDVDQFKQINDGFGHTAGDRVLNWVARQIEGVIRPGDLIARVGGDEFLIGLPNAGNGAAEEIAARLTQRIRGETLTFAGMQIPVTISVGVTTAGADDAELEGVIMRADSALYQAKAAGRDCHRGALPPGEARPCPASAG